MLAVLENFQDEQGSVAVPEALQQYGAPGQIGPFEVATIVGGRGARAV
jgi:seryl-tRNA synthetase